MKRSGNIAVVFALRHPLLTATTIVMIGRRRAIAECTAMVEIDYDLRYCIFDENFRENNMVISKTVLSQLVAPSQQLKLSICPERNLGNAKVLD